MGLKGLALATSISANICTILLFISFRRKLGPFGMKHTIISGVKIIGASWIMGIIAKVSYEYLRIQLNGNIALLATIMIGALAYFVMILFARIQEVDNMVSAGRSRFRRLLERRVIGK